MGKQSVEVRTSSSLNSSGDGLPSRHHLKIGSQARQFGGSDAREHAQDVQIREFSMVIAGGRGTVQDDGHQALLLGLAQTID